MSHAVPQNVASPTVLREASNQSLWLPALSLSYKMKCILAGVSGEPDQNWSPPAARLVTALDQGCSELRGIQRKVSPSLGVT